MSISYCGNCLPNLNLYCRSVVYWENQAAPRSQWCWWVWGVCLNFGSATFLLHWPEGFLPLTAISGPREGWMKAGTGPRTPCPLQCSPAQAPQLSSSPTVLWERPRGSSSRLPLNFKIHSGRAALKKGSVWPFPCSALTEDVRRVLGGGSRDGGRGGRGGFAAGPEPARAPVCSGGN